MDILHHTGIEAETKSATVPFSAGQFSGRLLLWMSGFGVFSAGLFFLTPGILITLSLVAMISIFHVVFVARWTDKFLASRTMCTIAGSLLAALILWSSILAGNGAIALSGLDYSIGTVVLASMVSLVTFATLIVVENALAIGLQVVLARKYDAAPHIACMLDYKCAGLLGEIR